MFSVDIGFAGSGADFYVYYPFTTSKRLAFLSAWSAIWISSLFCNILGVAIATGVANVPAWQDAHAISSGALIFACFIGLGGLGSLSTIVSHLALSLIMPRVLTHAP